MEIQPGACVCDRCSEKREKYAQLPSLFECEHCNLEYFGLHIGIKYCDECAYRYHICSICGSSTERKLTFGYPEGSIILTTRPEKLVEQLTGVPRKKVEQYAKAFGLNFAEPHEKDGDEEIEAV